MGRVSKATCTTRSTSSARSLRCAEEMEPQMHTDAHRCRIPNLCLSVFICGFILLSPARAEPAPVGMNPTAVNYYATEYPFVDVFRSSQPLVSQKEGAAYGKGDPQEMREDGYPARLSPGHYMNTLMCVGNPRYRGGKYVCLYDGKGKIFLGRDAKTTAQRPGRIDAHVMPDSGITLTIRETDPADPVRNIRLVPAEFDQPPAREPFAPGFLDTWRGVGGRRFMAWRRTNGRKGREWNDR